MITAILVDHKNDTRWPIEDIKREDRIDSVSLVLRGEYPHRLILASGVDIFNNGELIGEYEFPVKCVYPCDTITIYVIMDCPKHPSLKRIQ